jgi:hypothetical protein
MPNLLSIPLVRKGVRTHVCFIPDLCCPNNDLNDTIGVVFDSFLISCDKIITLYLINGRR